MLNNTGFEFPTKIERTRNLSDMLEEVVDEKFYISNEKAEKLISQLKDLKPQTLTANYRRVEKQDTEIAGALVSTDLVSMQGNFGGTNCVCVDGGYVPMVTETRPCLTPDRIEKRQNGRRFKEDGEDMFTLTGQDRHGVMIKQATKDGEIFCKDGGALNYGQPNSKTRRGRVIENGNISPTLTTQEEIGVLQVGNIVDTGNGDNPQRADRQGLKVMSDYRIRKLTPKECWRLMGFGDECFEKAEQVNSNSQLYKQAGNSIVVDVLVGIISQVMLAKSKWLDELLGGI